MSRKRKRNQLESGFIETLDGRIYLVGSNGVRMRSSEYGQLLPRRHRVLGISGKSYRRQKLNARRVA